MPTGEIINRAIGVIIIGGFCYLVWTRMSGGDVKLSKFSDVIKLGSKTKLK